VRSGGVKKIQQSFQTTTCFLLTHQSTMSIFELLAGGCAGEDHAANIALSHHSFSITFFLTWRFSYGSFGHADGDFFYGRV
jgi:hypothetical protein